MINPLFLLDRPIAYEDWLRMQTRGARKVLLIESAVLMLDQPVLQTLPEQLTVFVLQQDLMLRGLADRELPRQVTVVDYAGFVELTVEYYPVIHV